MMVLRLLAQTSNRRTYCYLFFQYSFDFFKYGVTRLRGGSDQFLRLIDTLLGGFSVEFSGNRGDSLLLSFISDMRVGDIYKARWQIESFFKMLKQNFKIKTFIGTSENAVRIQVWTGWSQTPV